MLPRIKQIEAQDNFILHVIFDDGKTVLYDVKEDIQTLPTYRSLMTEYGLFKNSNLIPAGLAFSGMMKSTYPVMLYMSTASLAKNLIQSVRRLLPDALNCFYGFINENRTIS